MSTVVGGKGKGRTMAGGLLVLVISLLLLAACGGDQSFDEPPEILYGQDVCSACNMIINEENFASAYWTADGEVRMFDDLGEMMLYMNEHQEEVASSWMHDMHTAEWLNGNDAWVVKGVDLRTPMGTGVASVANEEEALALVFGQDEAMVMTFNEMMSKVASGEITIQMGHGGMMEEDASHD